MNACCSTRWPAIAPPRPTGSGLAAGSALESWGLDPDLPREQWETSLPPAHVAFLRGLKRMHREGDYLFVHAGIRPGVPLTDQVAGRSRQYPATVLSGPISRSG